MQQSSKYSWAYSVGFLYSYVLTMPHSVAVNLAYPDKISVNGASPCRNQSSTYARVLLLVFSCNTVLYNSFAAEHHVSQREKIGTKHSAGWISSKGQHSRGDQGLMPSIALHAGPSAKHAVGVD